MSDAAGVRPTEHGLFQQPWPEGEYRFFQLGFCVDDLLGAAERWVRVYGVGPFHVLPRGKATSLYRGVESQVDLQVAVAQAGPVQVELMQQFCDSPSVYRELFAASETGLHQLCTITRDFDGKKLHLEGLGYPQVSELDTGSGRVAFYDTVGDFGFFTEVAEYSSTFLGHVAKISETCASWDGSDPIRLLTRDGYRTP